MGRIGKSGEEMMGWGEVRLKENWEKESVEEMKGCGKGKSGRDKEMDRRLEWKR